MSSDFSELHWSTPITLWPAITTQLLLSPLLAQRSPGFDLGAAVPSTHTHTPPPATLHLTRPPSWPSRPPSLSHPLLPSPLASSVEGWCTYSSSVSTLWQPGRPLLPRLPLLGAGQMNMYKVRTHYAHSSLMEATMPAVVRGARAMIALIIVAFVDQARASNGKLRSSSLVVV